MSLYIPKMSDTPGVTIPGLASNFQALDGSQIVEWGSNENGTYWRWENGLQVCMYRTQLGMEAVYRGVQPFPAPFSSSGLPAVFISVYAWSGSDGAVANQITKFGVKAGRDSSFNVGATKEWAWEVQGATGYWKGMYLFAVGRWK